jgi:magnesium chelatase subunit D
MKLALVLNVIDPLIGGVLIMGHRGTGKSTAVRALADLLPDISTVFGCLYRCDPADESNSCSECMRNRASGEKLRRVRSPIRIVDLPLGATEDRVCGTIDIERALKDGIRSFEPGLLARANRGFLYIDEVNLLEDHLVDLLLDVAATGRNKVERESISIEHPARFVLIGSGNPEEGELRPQLLDRFGLHVEVKTENDPNRRVEIVELREAFESDAAGFRASLAKDQQRLQRKITRAQEKAGDLKIDRALLRQIAQLCTELRIDGHRGELTIARAARALAAFEGRRKVTGDDVRRVAVMSLRHRLRRDPLEETAGSAQIQRALDKLFPGPPGKSPGGSGNNGGAEGFNTDGNQAVSERSAAGVIPRQSASPTGKLGGERPGELSFPPASHTGLPEFEGQHRSRVGPRQSRTKSNRSGLRNHTGVRRTSLNYERGRYATAVSLRTSGARVAIDATLRAFAGVACRVSDLGKRHPLTPGAQQLISGEALRYKKLARKSGTMFILAIDASGSMALNRISQAKSAALSLLKRSYIKRDRVAIVGFRGTSAEVLLPPSRSMLRARRVLDSLGVGGGTPLSAGLRCSLELAKQARSDAGEIVLLLFTDGHANVAVGGNGRANRRAVIEKEVAQLALELRGADVRTVVVDTQNAFISNGDARALAEKLGAGYVFV